MTQRVHHPVLRYMVPPLIGLAGAVFGAIVGLIAGANIGGNWATSLSFDSLHGYEVTAMFGAAVGALAIGEWTLWLAIRHWPDR